MNLTAELSLYPFSEDYVPPIRAFIARLEAVDGLHVETHPTCTIISGPDELVFATLRDGLRWCRESGGPLVLVTKFLPGHSLD